MGDYINYIQ